MVPTQDGSAGSQGGMGRGEGGNAGPCEDGEAARERERLAGAEGGNGCSLDWDAWGGWWDMGEPGEGGGGTPQAGGTPKGQRDAWAGRGWGRDRANVWGVETPSSQAEGEWGWLEDVVAEAWGMGPVQDEARVGVAGVACVSQGEERGEDKLPSHLVDLYDRSCVHLEDGQRVKLRELLREFQDVFSSSDFDLGHFTMFEHVIDTGTAAPIRSKMRRTPAVLVDEERKELEKMLAQGVIQRSHSPWAATPVLVRKRDGDMRYCLDFRPLNRVTIKDSFPLPLVEECLDTLSGQEWFSKLDANSAYWQVGIREEDKQKTAFITKYGLFEFVRMPFGLTNAPATFARVVEWVLRGLTWRTALAFLDDILVMGKAVGDHLDNLREVLERFRASGLKLKPRKCALFQRETEFLGRRVGKGVVAVSDADAKVVAEWPRPESKKEVESFLGLVNYHRGFVPAFAEMAHPLYGLTGKRKFVWDEQKEESFCALRKALVSPPVLALPTDTGHFVLDTDASDWALGGVLSQVQDGVERVVGYHSVALDKAQRKYCTTRKELLAVVRMVHHWKHYLLGRFFTIRSDHASLMWLLKFKDMDGQLARWMEALAVFHYVVVHRKGVKHGNADALSRYPGDPTPCQSYVEGLDPRDLPCGGCKYCSRSFAAWEEFRRTVDDTLPVPVVAPRVRAIELPLEDRWLHEGWFGGMGGVPVCESGGGVPEGEASGGEMRVGEVASVDQEGSTQGPGSWWGEDCGSGGGALGGDAAGGEMLVGAVASVDQEGSTQEPGSWWGEDLSVVGRDQAEDPLLKLLWDYLVGAVEPAPEVVALASPSQKFYWVNREQFFVSRGLLFRRTLEYGNQLVVPSVWKDRVLQTYHDSPSAAHQGVARTKSRIRERLYWHGLSRDVRDYVATCEVCARCKKTQRQGRAPLSEYHAGAPMERLHVDFLGPLPRTKKGNVCILVAVDQFTKWVEVVPLPSQTAEVTARALVGEVFSRLGCPRQLFTDQGRNFESKLVRTLCRYLGIHKARTTPYRPSANGQVERYNRTLMDAVRCYVGKVQGDWDEHLPQIAGALRSAKVRSTGLTANEMMLGREVVTPAHAMFAFPPGTPQEPDEYVAGLHKRMNLAHEVARSTLRTSIKTAKRDHDLRILVRPYEVGDLVYLLDSAVKKGECAKLKAPWQGPGVIVKKLGPYVFQVRTRTRVLNTNHDRLMPCRARRPPKWLVERAAQAVSGGSEDEDDGTEYCTCRKPCGGRFMIACDACDEWYHGDCVDVEEGDAWNLDVYRCPSCVAAGRPILPRGAETE